MHLKRWITALVALPLIILLILKGGPALFALTIAVVAVLTLIEYLRIAFASHETRLPWTFTTWTCLGGLAVIAAVHYGYYPGIVHVLALHLIGCGLLAVKRYAVSRDAPLVAVKLIFGMVYIPVLFACVVHLRNGVDGIQWVSLLLCVIALGDIGAYYVGSYLGKHKLFPAASPKKTIEGAVGGLASNLVAAWAFNLLFMDQAIPVFGLVLYAFLVGAAGQVGDLFESIFKREAGIKDSGGLLPGHGGFLDRVDALLFGAPVAVMLKEYLLL